jgi:AcrR family transcriptional regulator
MAKAGAHKLVSDVRTQLMQAATHRFAEHGFAATSLQDISSDIGITKQSLLYYFASKEALRQGVLEAMLEHFADELPRLLLGATSGKRRFENVMGATIAYFHQEPRRARLLLREMLDRPLAARQLLEHHLAPWVGLVTDTIRRGQTEGVIHSDLDPEAYVFQVMHLVLAGFALHNVSPPIYDEQADGTGAKKARGAERHTNELIRFAKAALFLPRGATPRST